VQLTFLGTSAGIPTRERGLSALALRTGAGPLWLVDCGEGTQQRMLAAELRLSRVSRVLITHLHGDHCFGLPGLLATMGVFGRRDPVEVAGPEGLRGWLETTLAATATRIPYPLALTELAAGRSHALEARDGLALEAWPLVHRAPSFAWVVREPARRGALDAARARALGVPDGPLLGRLAGGEAVTLADGRRVEPGAVLGPERPGRVLALCGDSTDSRVLAGCARGCDVLVHECTFETALAAKAREWGHSTADDVAELARRVEPRLLALTHFSTRYTVPGAAPDVEALRAAVAAGCPRTRVVAAHDGLALDVPPRRAPGGAGRSSGTPG
jgi:ribonuclease Z